MFQSLVPRLSPLGEPGNEATDFQLQKLLMPRPPSQSQKLVWRVEYETLMVFHVPISFAHSNGVSTLKGACMNQIERKRERRREKQEKREEKGG